jgi:hypothetical protein
MIFDKLWDFIRSRREEANITGSPRYSDWLGLPLTVGSYVAFPSESAGKGLERTAMQMTAGWIESIGEHGCEIRVDRRSRTGTPQGRQRKYVKLTRVGMANVTVLLDTDGRRTV